MSVHFVTFGSDDYRTQVERITREARHTGWFQTVKGMYTTDLDSQFLEKHSGFLKGRGYGYWIWKPQIILQTLNEIPENDILVYADSGSTLNKKGFIRFSVYLQSAKKHPSGIVSFQMPNLPEFHWTKKEVFEKLGYEHSKTPQVCATYFVVRNCENSRTLIKQWSDITQSYSLVDDTRYITQYPDFKDHRHDQSVWSILNKKYKTCIFPDDDGYPPGRQAYPIWGTRIRGDQVSSFRLDVLH
jgi:hypothetical protein